MLPQTVATFVSFPLNHPASSCSVGCLDWNCFHSTRGFFSLGCMGMRQSPSLRYSSTKLGSSVIGVRLRYGLRRREAHGDPGAGRRDVVGRRRLRISDRTSLCLVRLATLLSFPSSLVDRSNPVDYPLPVSLSTL